MGKKKSSEHKHGNILDEQMQNLQDQGCRQVLTLSAQGGHPRDQVGTNRKKKSLLEVIGPAEVGGNSQKSKKRGYAAAVEGSRRQLKKNHGYVGAAGKSIQTTYEHSGSPSAEQENVDPKPHEEKLDQFSKEMLQHSDMHLGTLNCAAPLTNEELSDEPLVRGRHISTTLNTSVQVTTEEPLHEPCLENVLNCIAYGEEVGCEAINKSFGNCSKEDLGHLLALLPPCERDAFIRTHPNFAFANPTINVHQSNLVSEEEFNEKMRELDREEKKFQKKQAKKLLKQAAKIARVEDGLLVSNPMTHGLKPPATPAKCNSVVVGQRLGSKAMKKKDLTPFVVSDQDLGGSDLNSWGTLQKIRAFEVNSLAMPVGEFMEHMWRYAFQQAYLEFPWDKDWNKPCPQLKA